MRYGKTSTAILLLGVALIAGEVSGPVKGDMAQVLDTGLVLGIHDNEIIYFGQFDEQWSDRWFFTLNTERYVGNIDLWEPWEQKWTIYTMNLQDKKRRALVSLPATNLIGKHLLFDGIDCDLLRVDSKGRYVISVRFKKRREPDQRMLKTYNENTGHGWIPMVDYFLVALDPESGKAEVLEKMTDLGKRDGQVLYRGDNEYFLRLEDKVYPYHLLPWNEGEKAPLPEPVKDVNPDRTFEGRDLDNLYWYHLVGNTWYREGDWAQDALVDVPASLSEGRLSVGEDDRYYIAHDKTVYRFDSGANHWWPVQTLQYPVGFVGATKDGIMVVDHQWVKASSKNDVRTRNHPERVKEEKYIQHRTVRYRQISAVYPDVPYELVPADDGTASSHLESVEVRFGVPLDPDLPGDEDFILVDEWGNRQQTTVDADASSGAVALKLKIPLKPGTRYHAHLNKEIYDRSARNLCQWLRWSFVATPGTGSVFSSD